MTLSTDKKAQLKTQAAAGNMVAQALLDMSLDIELTKGVEAANIIKVTGIVRDGVGLAVPGVKNVIVTSVCVAGAGGLTDGGAGVFKAGSTTKVAWLQTDANGKFEVNVTNASAEDNLIHCQLGNGDDAMIVLTFA